jgi:hypothetical protein
MCRKLQQSDNFCVLCVSQCLCLTQVCITTLWLFQMPEVSNFFSHKQLSLCKACAVLNKTLSVYLTAECEYPLYLNLLHQVKPYITLLVWIPSCQLWDYGLKYAVNDEISFLRREYSNDISRLSFVFDFSLQTSISSFLHFNITRCSKLRMKLRRKCWKL